MARGDEASSIDLDAVEKQRYLLSPIVLRGFMVCNTLRAWGMNRESRHDEHGGFADQRTA